MQAESDFEGRAGAAREHARLEWHDPESDDRLVVDVVGDAAFLRDLAALGFRRQHPPGEPDDGGGAGRVRFAALERRPGAEPRLDPPAPERWLGRAGQHGEDRGEVRRKGA